MAQQWKYLVFLSPWFAHSTLECWAHIIASLSCKTSISFLIYLTRKLFPLAMAALSSLASTFFNRFNSNLTLPRHSFPIDTTLSHTFQSYSIFLPQPWHHSYYPKPNIPLPHNSNLKATFVRNEIFFFWIGGIKPKSEMSKHVVNYFIYEWVWLCASIINIEPMSWV